MALIRVSRVGVALLTVLLAATGVARPQERGLTLVGEAPRTERRVALVIGNSRYENTVGALVNPANDAQDMSQVLAQLGFQVTLELDLNKERIEQAVEKFQEAAGESDIALFYFAGHGVQVDNVNFIIPVEAKIRTQSDAKTRAVSASWVLDKMGESGSRANVMILDACRNNPLPKGGRSGGRGLAPMQTGRGSMVAFAAAPGQAADENAGERNGLYTSELMKNMRQPGISIVEVFQRTREGVDHRSNQGQTPQDWNQLVGTIYLAGAPSGDQLAMLPVPLPAPLPPPQVAAASGVSPWWWVAGGVVAAGAIAGSSGKKSNKSKSTSSGGVCSSGCGSIGSSW